MKYIDGMRIMSGYRNVGSCAWSSSWKSGVHFKKI